jgi:hypothetical protein
MHNLLRLIPISTAAAVTRSPAQSARSGAGLAAVCGRIVLGACLGLAACASEDGEPNASTQESVEAGSNGSSTDSSDAGTTNHDGGGAAAAGDQGKGDGSDVIMIGDSWMSQFDPMGAIQGGVLKASGQPYRAYAVGGTTLLGTGLLGFLTPIPTQYENAIQADPDVKTVIMTGGGNDILQSGLQADCDMQGEACGAQVVMILDRLSRLWADMAEDGVRDVVYILYATPAGKSVDFALPDGDSAVKRCADVPAPLRCHILPTLDLVMGDIPDGIHPSQAASDRIGEAVFALMNSEGMRR